VRREFAMSKILVQLAAIAACSLLVPGVASATHSENENPPYDLVSGSGKVGTLFGSAEEFSVSAHNNTPDREATGFLNFRMVEFTGDVDAGKGHVLCANVQGNRAAVIARLKEPNPFPGFGVAVLLVEDNGEPSDLLPDRGLATALPVESGVPADCGFSFIAFVGFATSVVTSGNVVVHDGTP
jgi:hypothetical protein